MNIHRSSFNILVGMAMSNVSDEEIYDFLSDKTVKKFFWDITRSESVDLNRLNAYEQITKRIEDQTKELEDDIIKAKWENTVQYNTLIINQLKEAQRIILEDTPLTKENKNKKHKVSFVLNDPVGPGKVDYIDEDFNEQFDDEFFEELSSQMLTVAVIEDEIKTKTKFLDSHRRRQKNCTLYIACLSFWTGAG